MIEAIPAPPHVAAFRFTGTLTGQDYDRCIGELEACLQEYQRIAVVSDLTGLTGLSLEAMGKDLHYALSKIGEFSRFARAAVITDKAWLGKVSELAAMWIPGVDMRAYEPHQAQEALAWAAELPAEDRAD